MLFLSECRCWPVLRDFLVSSVWVRSARYNRKLYNNIMLSTKNSVPERAGEGSARESTRTHVGKAQADAAEPKIIAAEAHDPCGTTCGAHSVPVEVRSLGRSSPDPDRSATNWPASSRRATRGERSAPGAIPGRLRRRSLQNASDKGRDLRQRFSTPNARRRDRAPHEMVLRKIGLRCASYAVLRHSRR